MFGKRVIADVIREDEVTLKEDRPLISYDCCPYRKRGDDAKTDTRRGHV